MHTPDVRATDALCPECAQVVVYAGEATATTRPCPSCRILVPAPVSNS